MVVFSFQRIGKSYARLEIVPWGGICGRMVLGSEFEMTIEGSQALHLPVQWRRVAQVPIAQAVLVFPGRTVEIVAEAQIHGQPAIDLPVILHVAGPVSVARHIPRRMIVPAAASPTEKHRGKSVALDRGSREPVLAGDLLAKREAPGRVPGQGEIEEIV